MARTRSRSRNQLLDEMIHTVGVTHDTLARTVNKVGAEAGHHLHYDRSSVAHWIAGSMPRDPVPGFIAEAFARHCHRYITTEELGLASAVSEEAAVVADTVGEVVRLGRAEGAPWKARVDRVEVRDLRRWAVAAVR